jgi:hypothetical protein
MTRNVYQPPEYRDDAVRRAVAKMKSFQDGDLAVLEVVACGDRAIPSLKAVLFDREPSGLCQVRTRAVDALAQLGAQDVLKEFLGTTRDVTDPVERLGEDAVINAAARALAHSNDPGIFELLGRLARRPCLDGVIFALGTFRQAKAIPLLIEALSEDGSRLVAEAALKKMGAMTRSALIETAIRHSSLHEHESESRLRQRRSVLKLLAEMGVSRRIWQAVRHLMRDKDTRIAVLACEICLAKGSPSEKSEAVLRLLRLYASADWTLRDEIERYLVAHLYTAKNTAAGAAQLGTLMTQDNAIRNLVERILSRVQGRRVAG